MEDALEQLTNEPLAADGPVTRLFRAAGAQNFGAAAHHVWKLPYGRIADRGQLGLVLSEGRGSCTTKHALLAALAREQHINAQLVLGIYEMSERNTPGVGQVLSRYGLSYIPEAHCHLRYKGQRIDVTGVPTGASPIEGFLYEEPIAVEQIGTYKNDVHKRFLGNWITRTEVVRSRNLEEVWRIREECIAALGAGEYANPDS